MPGARLTRQKPRAQLTINKANWVNRDITHDVRHHLILEFYLICAWKLVQTETKCVQAESPTGTMRAVSQLEASIVQ